MDITLPRNELVETGRRFRADYLAEQAGYTFGIAALEGVELSDLLSEGFLQDSQGLLEQLNLSRKDKTLMAEEAKDATSSLASAAESAKVWRRKAVLCASRATRLGRRMPDGLLTIGRARTSTALAGQMKEMTGLFEENLSLMPGKNAKKLLDEGKAILGVLSGADTEKNVKRSKELPAAVQDFYAQKGLLYTAIKIINDAGQELFADDSTAASRFNLHILYRRGNKKKKAAPPASTEG